MKITIKLRKSKNPDEITTFVELFKEVEALAQRYPIVVDVDMK